MKIKTENLKEAAAALHCGEKVELTGVVYTARDEAHKRLDELLNKGFLIPFEIKGAIIYYAGPTPAPFGLPVGSCGPTTSGRMDSFSPRLLDLGLAAMIGKGERNEDVRQAIIRNKAVYFSALGGAGALAAECVKARETVAFPELGCESINRFYFEDFPLIVAIDSEGRCVYDEGRKRYAIS